MLAQLLTFVRFAMFSSRNIVRFTTLGALLVLCDPANAIRRSTRVDAGGWSDQKAFGSSDCPGTLALSGNAAASLPLDWGSYRFHGNGDTAYTYNMYCQYTLPGEFNSSSMEFLDPPEPALRSLVGANTNDAVTGIRYTWMTADFLFGGPSFQWAFFSFPNGVTIVALYGLLDMDPFPPEPLVLDGSTAIKQGTATLWSAAGNSFDGEYFCFLDGEFAGLWNGELSDSRSACLEAAVIFTGSFE